MIQFLYPAILLGVPAALGFLIYVYRRRKNRTPKIVPTLFILKKFKTLASSRQKFFPPPRFFLEVLLLCGLLLGGAGIFKKNISPETIEETSLATKTNEVEEQKSGKLKIKLESVITIDETKIEKIPNLQLVSDADPKTVQLYHRKTPATLPNVPTLFVLPPDDNSLINLQSFSEEQEPVRWQATHPILRYANLPLLKLSRGKTFSNLPWAEDIISLRQGALVVAGEYNGIRYVFLGFEIFPFEGKESPTTSIITLNALHWLNYFPEKAIETNNQPAKAVKSSESISLLTLIACCALILLLLDMLIFRQRRA